jgi:hypothetical protein
MSQDPRLQSEIQDRAKLIAADLQASRQEQAGLEATQPVQPTFNERADPSADQVVETPSPDPDPTRTTSYAKSLDEDNQSAGDGLKTTFQSQAEPSQGEAQEGGSEMVENDKPEPEPSNKTPEGRASKAAEYDKALQAERERAGAVNDRAEQIAADLQADREQPQPDRQPGQGM